MTPKLDGRIRKSELKVLRTYGSKMDPPKNDRVQTKTDVKIQADNSVMMKIPYVVHKAAPLRARVTPSGSFMGLSDFNFLGAERWQSRILRRLLI